MNSVYRTYLVYWNSQSDRLVKNELRSLRRSMERKLKKSKSANSDPPPGSMSNLDRLLILEEIISDRNNAKGE